MKHISHLGALITLHTCDMCSFSDVASVLRRVKPDVVFHLAAITSVPQGEIEPELLFRTNLLGSLSLLEAARRYSPDAKLLMISSAEVYGKVDMRDNPIKEDQPVRPVHLYGLSKALAEKLALFYHTTLGLSTVILRPFNHIGPRQADSFVCSSFARQVALIDLRQTEPVICVGDLSPVRDFTDVRDVVNAYCLAAKLCKEGYPYHIASGTGCTIKDILDTVLSFTDIKIEVREDPARKRAVEIPVCIGDPSRFNNHTGWTRHYSLSQSLQDCFLYWKNNILAKTKA